MLSPKIIYAFLNRHGHGCTHFYNGYPGTPLYEVPEIVRLRSGVDKHKEAQLARGIRLQDGRYVVYAFDQGLTTPHSAMVICDLYDAKDDCGRKGLNALWAVPLAGDPKTDPDAYAHLVSIDQMVSTQFSSISAAVNDIASKPANESVAACRQLSDIMLGTYVSHPADGHVPCQTVEEIKPVRRGFLSQLPFAQQIKKLWAF